MVFNRIKSFLVNIYHRDESLILPDTDIRAMFKEDPEIGALELFVDAEDAFGFIMSDADMREIRTIGDLVRYIEERI